MVCSIAKGSILTLKSDLNYATRNALTRDCQVADHVTPRCREAVVPLRHDIALKRSSHCHEAVFKR